MKNIQLVWSAGWNTVLSGKQSTKTNAHGHKSISIVIPTTCLKNQHSWHSISQWIFENNARKMLRKFVLVSEDVCKTGTLSMTYMDVCRKVKKVRVYARRLRWYLVSPVLFLISSIVDLQGSAPGSAKRLCRCHRHHTNCKTAQLTGGNWQKWKRVFMTCPCHEIYRDEAVGLKSCKNTWKITIFVKMWNLGQYRENLIFCQ